MDILTLWITITMPVCGIFLLFVSILQIIECRNEIEQEMKRKPIYARRIKK